MLSLLSELVDSLDREEVDALLIDPVDLEEVEVEDEDEREASAVELDDVLLLDSLRSLTSDT